MPPFYVLDLGQSPESLSPGTSSCRHAIWGWSFAI